MAELAELSRARNDTAGNSEPGPAVIEADGVEVTFAGGTKALAGVSLCVHRGDFVSLIGPSGCGKTTMLRAVADLVQPNAGQLKVNGMKPEEARRQRTFGYVFQAPALLPWRTAKRNVTLPLELMGLKKAEREARAREYLGLVGLEEQARRFPWQLSGGMQQRVSIARALSFRPSLLLMDEPFGALDEITRDGLNLHLNALWRRTGMTVMFVTHSIPEAVFLSTRIVVMSARPGRVVEEISCNLQIARELEIRDSEEFLAVAQRVRAALRAGHSYD